MSTGFSPSGRRSRRPETLAFRLISWAVILLLVVVIGVPFFIMLSLSLQTMPEIYSADMVWLPEKLQFVNYADAMASGNWGRYILNSLYVTTLATGISLGINAMTGYAFARIPFKGRNFLFVLVLVGMMIPPQVTMVPLFSMMRHFPLAGGNDLLGNGGSGLVNTFAGLILPYIAGSFGVFMCRQYYAPFPRDLDEAAIIDGCSRFRIFSRIYLPISKPMLASLAILKFTGFWNEYTWPLVMTVSSSDRVKTVQIALTSFRNEGEIFWNLLMAATLVSSSFIYLLFLCLQKHFTAGILAGSVKG